MIVGHVCSGAGDIDEIGEMGGEGREKNMVTPSIGEGRARCVARLLEIYI